MSAAADSVLRPRLVTPEAEPEVEWDRFDEQIPAGEYQAYCQHAKLYFDGHFKRHICLLRWKILSQSQQQIACLGMWLNLGTGKKPRAGHRSRYFEEWVRANGALPIRGDRLSPKVFKRRMALVEVKDADPKNQRVKVQYSRVVRVIEWQTGRKLPNQSIN